MAAFALGLVNSCFRTPLEDIHAGKSVDTQTGDYSDVKVVTPTREIPWAELSRISDQEMKGLMIECVNRVFTLLMNPNLANLRTFRLDVDKRWNPPNYYEPWLEIAKEHLKPSGDR